MQVAQTRRTLSAALGLTAAVLLGLTPFASTQASAQAAGTPSKLYIESNITSANGNSVIGLQNDGTGKLSKLPGSPYLTNGVGVGAGNMTDDQWNADGELIMNAAGTLLWAVNGNSNTISTFSISATNGSLKLKGTPVASGGQQPAGLGLKENVLSGGRGIMVVANKASDPLQPSGVAPNYMTFTEATDGLLTPNKNSSYALPVGSSIAQVVPRRGSATQFFGVEFLNNTVSTYSSTKLGILSNIGSVSNPTPTPLLGATIHPTAQYLYVGEPGPNDRLAVLHWDSTGKLSFIKDVFAPGSAICWGAINAAGTRLYTSQTPASEVTVYDVSRPASPVLLQSFFVSGVGAAPAHMALDPSNSFLYVVDRLGSVHVLPIDSNGMVSEPNAPYSLGVPAGTVPLGVIVKP